MAVPVSEASGLLGDRLRELRRKAACSQNEIADLAGMDVANYGKIERGLGNPELYTLIRLATVLGVDVAELLAGIKGDALPERRRALTAKEFVRERSERR